MKKSNQQMVFLLMALGTVILVVQTEPEFLSGWSKKTIVYGLAIIALAYVAGYQRGRTFERAPVLPASPRPRRVRRWRLIGAGAILLVGFPLSAFLSVRYPYGSEWSHLVKFVWPLFLLGVPLYLFLRERGLTRRRLHTVQKDGDLCWECFTVVKGPRCPRCESSTEDVAKLWERYAPFGTLRFLAELLRPQTAGKHSAVDQPSETMS